MSLLESFTKKKALTTAINDTVKARASDGAAADTLYNAAYHNYAEVLLGDPLRSETLYNWGFALLHQAKTKTGDEAVKLYQEAIAKFYFCLLLNPSYLGSAINVGVAFMDLARLEGVDCYDETYSMARSYFDKANAIQAGSASYNIACIHALRDEKQACLEALENAKNRGYLPDAEEIMADPDLDKAKDQLWFVMFMKTLDKASANDEAENEASSETAEQAVETDATPEIEPETESVTDPESPQE
jgi:tetratricopeptide (TPR) repeat protein